MSELVEVIAARSVEDLTIAGRFEERELCKLKQKLPRFLLASWSECSIIVGKISISLLWQNAAGLEPFIPENFAEWRQFQS